MKLFTIAALTMTIATLPLLSHASTPFPVLTEKAQRFVVSKEWASAEAMYQLMADERPDDPRPYIGGIVAAGMRNQQEVQMRFMNAALKARIPFASLFDGVRTESFRLGSTSLYEKFLLLTARQHPWMERTIDNYLLNYYSFRRNPEAMIEYSRRMLAGMPDNVNYSLTLAQGYLLAGDVEKAVDTYQHIVENHPDNYEALLYIGMYYSSDNSNKSVDKAVGYLSKAYALRPTPYVEKVLKTLSKTK